jgi:hypothetical protein
MASEFIPARGPVVGVTGHRPAGLSGADQPALVRQLRHVLDALRHREGASVLVSALAEGADRLVAANALELGYELEAVLPLAPEDYERDFTAVTSRRGFRRLLARARGVEVLDGPRAAGGGSRVERYAAAGARVVARSDLLVALWDGEPARGRGGTGEIVSIATAAGVPVVWVSTRPPHPVVVLEGPGSGGRGPSLAARLGGVAVRVNATD